MSSASSELTEPRQGSSGIRIILESLQIIIEQPYFDLQC